MTKVEDPLNDDLLQHWIDHMAILDHSTLAKLAARYHLTLREIAKGQKLGEGSRLAKWVLGITSDEELKD
jgi:hypothetical protein